MSNLERITVQSQCVKIPDIKYIKNYNNPDGKVVKLQMTKVSSDNGQPRAGQCRFLLQSPPNDSAL